MIPPTIHTIWIGKNPMTELNRKCVASMIQHLPVGWKFVIHGNNEAVRIPWVKKMMDAGVYAMASDYLRIKVLHDEGGIYLDADVQVLKPFETDMDCFIGFQRDDTFDGCVNTAVCGGVAGHWLFQRLLARYDDTEPCRSQIFACNMPTDELYARGMRDLNKTQMVDDVKVFSRDYFHPIYWNNRSMNYVSDNTVCIHQFQSQWT